MVGDDGQPQHLPWEDWRPGEDQNTSAWMRATSPSGSAAMEGKVAWSGELGYGVRAPEADQATKDSMADPHPVVGQDGGVLHDHSATDPVDSGPAGGH